MQREGDANGADVSLVLEGEEERLVRCSHGNGPAPDHVCESAWLDGTLYQGSGLPDCHDLAREHSNAQAD